MPFIDDFATAINDYVDDYVTFTTVLNLATDNIAPATPNAINVNERWRFRVNVSNNNHLDMIGVQLRIEGLNGTTVSTAAAGPFTASVTSPALLTVNGFGSQTSGYFYFQAPSTAKAAGTDLVKAYINAFDVSLTHLLNSHTGAESGKFGIYENQVLL
jgi:hypothetical protein